MLSRKRLLLTLVAAAALATPTSSRALIVPDGYCSHNVIDLRDVTVFVRDACGDINWGETWNYWFG